MGNYNFDEKTSRRGTNCMKWDDDETGTLLPMWVADMDFRTAPAIVDAIIKRAEHGIFGYEHVPQSYYVALTSWFRRRYKWMFKPEWVICTTGVVPAVSAIIKAMAQPGDRVLVQTPVYNCFFSSIRNNGCKIEEAPLVYENGTYHIDFDSFERHCAKPDVKLFLLCNPHNPAGRVWTRNELTLLGNICLRHNVFVVADEIHCDITMPGCQYTPFASLSNRFLRHSATCNAPTKTFNIAGLQIANIIASNQAIRARINKAININEVCDVSPFGVAALEAAYNNGEEWLDELLQYLKANYDYLCAYISRNKLPLTVVRLEGTYLVWIDCAALKRPSDVIVDELKRLTGLWVNGSTMYGERERPFIRMNIACPRATLKDGLDRLKRYVSTITNEK